MRIASLLIFIITIIISLFLLPQLPDTLSITTGRRDYFWDRGITIEVNKYIFIFFIPFIMVLFHLILRILERLEPNHTSLSISEKKRRSLSGNLYSIRLIIMLIFAVIQFYYLFKNLNM